MTLIPRPQVMLYGRASVELLKAKPLWARLARGLVHHIYVGRGRGMLARCVELVARLYQASGTDGEWDRVMANLRFRFLARLQSPDELIVIQTPGQDSSAFVRHAGDGEFRRVGSAMDYWWSLDETLDDHRWQIAWAEAPLDASLLAGELERLFGDRPGLPARAWEAIVSALYMPRKSAVSTGRRDSGPAAGLQTGS